MRSRMNVFVKNSRIVDESVDADIISIYNFYFIIRCNFILVQPKNNFSFILFRIHFEYCNRTLLYYQHVEGTNLIA